MYGCSASTTWIHADIMVLNLGGDGHILFFLESSGFFTNHLVGTASEMTYHITYCTV